MKSVKTILIAATLICATAVSTMSAQQAAQPAAHQFSVAKGDTVMFNRSIEQYCTGEKPSRWVYDKTFVVRQLGSKRFPDGVLLMPILSWIRESDLDVVNGRADEAKAEAAAALAAEDEAA